MKLFFLISRSASSLLEDDFSISCLKVNKNTTNFLGKRENRQIVKPFPMNLNFAKCGLQDIEIGHNFIRSKKKPSQLISRMSNTR